MQGPPGPPGPEVSLLNSDNKQTVLKVSLSASSRMRIRVSQEVSRCSAKYLDSSHQGATVCGFQRRKQVLEAVNIYKSTPGTH